jgi:hypothetical protein
MSTVIACPACSRSLNLPDDALSRSVQCPRCGATFVPTSSPKEPAANQVIVEKDEVVPPPIRDLPPPPGPLVPVVLSSTRDSPPDDELDSGLERCPKCRARTTRTAERCPACGARLNDNEPTKPWEERGAVRRDSEPHRGGLILALGRVSLCLSIPGLLGVCFWAFAAASLLGTGLGFTVTLMAKDDLEQMERKTMDAEGRQSTEAGQRAASIGMILGIVGLLLAGLLRLPLLFAGLF